MLPFKVVFVLSATRSGSTWLSLVLGSTSWAAHLGEFCRPFTRQGHVVCRLCEAEGLDRCSVFDGIERVQARDAFHFAAERAGKPVLIDASKQLEWCGKFVDREDLDVRLVHLVRNPCGYVESEHRRHPNRSFSDLLEQWERVNRNIEEFVGRSERQSTMECYDHLIDRPADTFPSLCNFIGHTWEPEALQYWTIPHHGLGGNGAASLYLRGRKVEKFLTGDDAYYAGLTEETPRSDKRWVNRLPDDFCRSAVSSAYARKIQQKVGDW
ncbi:MAG: hypothetical protein KIS73_26485 [Enhydrobacter sp.]|nr:hypothetical protein [Enhydrobacter sp.]